ncbi:uncharacterized protein FFUJ_03799 [Fusarium fujikuroi IMI 58289]|uniref:Uncharacterized protein n=1 Tax=Gibberella fujikuroi (strain CBS 195.34 / IMI 58289 / NRRL A-6831) TaxID=1279085 RepID=S0DQU5_GIBF5|nr:uncharacterized protein FFUJ_03799 [Fusarium fujikuroi IMI 58289]CCT64934.1 uncharacterized protein FFUJ_03799 [Fusarium fujikuroi IMI 58289]SCN71826.1 uncharacterized protein FFE2_02394 [Fusarium fujikuroi]SCN90133.1 uncharacterized protein FFM5_04884 [Fusarium fujikuroi]
MAADEISDQRYAEIIQIKEKLAGTNNSLIPFLERVSAIDIVSPLQSPKEWLQKLSVANFADSVGITNLSYALTADNMDDFDLVTDSEVTFTVCAFPGALSLHPEPTKKPSAHSALVSLSIELEDPSTPRLGHCHSQPLPSLVLPIGQLQKVFMTARGIPRYIDIDYILVVDAAGTSHAVWLIYDRYQRFDEFKDVTDPKRAPLVFSSWERTLLLLKFS